MPDNTNVINQIYQQYLGRQPTNYELQGFNQAMQNNILDPIGLMQFVQSTSEYQQKVAPQNAQDFAGQLQGLQQKSTDQTLKQGYDQAVGRYAQMGRPDSTGLASSFAQVAGQAAANNSNQTAQQVGGYLGGAYGGLTNLQQNYGNMYNQGYSNYQNYINNSNLMNQQAQIDYNKIYASSQSSMGGNQRGLLNMRQYSGYSNLFPSMIGSLWGGGGYGGGGGGISRGSSSN